MTEVHAQEGQHPLGTGVHTSDWLTQKLPAVLDETEESGWKNIHGEVFRFPPNKNLFCAFVGSGFQVAPSFFCLPL